MNEIDLVLRDVCELEADDPEDEDTLLVSYDHLKLILERHVLLLIDDRDEARRKNANLVASEVQLLRERDEAIQSLKQEAIAHAITARERDDALEWKEKLTVAVESWKRVSDQWRLEAWRLKRQLAKEKRKRGAP